MGEIKKVYSQLRMRDEPVRRLKPIRATVRCLLTFLFLANSALAKGPGVGFHLRVVGRAMRLIGTEFSLPKIYGLITSPMDSFRYFEFDFFWRCLSKRKSLGNYLDVSSPRLFSWLVLNSGKTSRALISNPDQKDLTETDRLFKASGISKICELREALVNELLEPPESFNMVVCISVLEHIPADAAPGALKIMWDLVRPGGSLLLSVPCASHGFEEYVDFNEYGLLVTDSEGYVFGQRFYDQKMLETDIYSIVGTPSRSAVFGEKIEGFFMRNREQKLSNAEYPFWRESYMMASQYKYFDHIQNMPGLGVVAFEFHKQ